VAAIGALTRPVLAVVNGDAVAEGCELALACDLRIAFSGARFSLPQISEGRLPAHGATQRLPRIIGRMRAMEMLLTGRFMTAREALNIGLVSRVAARAQLATVVREEVESLRNKGAIALRLAKDAVVKGLDLTLEQGIRLEQDLYVLLQTTADRQEGIQAFLEKRKPRFRGAWAGRLDRISTTRHLPGTNTKLQENERWRTNSARCTSAASAAPRSLSPRGVAVRSSAAVPRWSRRSSRSSSEQRPPGSLVHWPSRPELGRVLISAAPAPTSLRGRS
jgi:hypothetical protein